jgi:hypothetical protein
MSSSKTCEYRLAHDLAEAESAHDCDVGPAKGGNAALTKSVENRPGK